MKNGLSELKFKIPIGKNGLLRLDIEIDIDSSDGLESQEIKEKLGSAFHEILNLS